MLGDGHAETSTQGRTYRLKIEHSCSQKQYVDWLYEELQSLTSSPPKIKLQIVKGKQYQKYWFNTKYSGSLRFYAQQFYQGKKKQIPKLIHRWLTPLTLAIWFMDDGSIKSRTHKAKILNIQGFTKPEVERLIAALDNKYGIKAKLRKQKEGYQIYLLSETIKEFERLLKPYIIPTMRYKLG